MTDTQTQVIYALTAAIKEAVKARLTSDQTLDSQSEWQLADSIEKVLSNLPIE